MLALNFISKQTRSERFLRCCSNRYLHTQHPQQLQKRRFTQSRLVNASTAPSAYETALVDDNAKWPRKIFSGVQPTGSLHLGNYLGAVGMWHKLQEARDNVTYCIVDMHSITLPQDPKILREHIFQMAATLLACGIDPKSSTLFVQSAVKEHTELCWILSTLSTMARLGHLPQYKEKTRQLKEIPLGLFVYPVLQAADIMLYRATHVPVGEDQLQHIQLTQHLSRIFNTRFGPTFPVCHAMLENKESARIRSLRDPTKKMSKSDPDTKATIYLTDAPEVIVEKVKKAVTDFSSDVTYEPEVRLGVSNLIAIHAHLTGQTITQVVEEAKGIDTGNYKLRVADAIVEHLKPISEKIAHYLQERSELVTLLHAGAERARDVATDTIDDVKQRMGLGVSYLPVKVDLIPTPSDDGASDLQSNKRKAGMIRSGAATKATAQSQSPIKYDSTIDLMMSKVPHPIAPVPIVPTQKIRIEKARNFKKLDEASVTVELMDPALIQDLRFRSSEYDGSHKRDVVLPERKTRSVYATMDTINRSATASLVAKQTSESHHCFDSSERFNGLTGELMEPRLNGKASRSNYGKDDGVSVASVEVPEKEAKI